MTAKYSRRATDCQGRRWPGALRLELEFLYLLAEGVAMDLQVLGGLGEVPAVLLEDAGDEPLLELAARVREEDAPVDHLRHQRLQLLLHRVTPPLQAAER